MDDDQHRAAWTRKYAREPNPWRGPADLDALLALAAGAIPHAPRVIETGAAGGKTLAALPDPWRVTPVDWVRASLPPGGIIADARALPFRDASHDVILFVFVLGHLDEAGRAAAAQEARRVLAPGGVALVRAFTPEDMRATKGRPLDEPGAFEREGLRHVTLPAAAIRALFQEFQPLAEVEREVPTRFGAKRAFVDAAYAAPG